MVTSGRGQQRRGRSASYWLAVAAVAGVTAAFVPFTASVSPTTVGFALLLAVLFCAAGGGLGPAVVASLLGVLCFNFFFLPPVHTLAIHGTENWVALGAFLVTAITAGQLSAHARNRANDAETAHREIELLYTQLREAFDRASRAEALRQAEQMRSALLDAVTHDLRTPLTSIKVSVSTLLDEARAADPDGEAEPLVLDPESRLEMLEVIDEETDRLDRFIGNFVELARIEAGQMQLRRVWTSPEAIVSTAVERAAGPARGRRIEVSVDPAVPAVHADGRAVAEALYTIVENAAKYAPPHTTIRVSVGAYETGAVLFAVEDEGPGIPAEARERVFDKFYRVGSGEHASAPPGTGMGLAIARGIVEAHGGRVWVEDGAGGAGARVAFTIPVGGDDDLAPSIGAPEPPALGDEGAPAV